MPHYHHPSPAPFPRIWVIHYPLQEAYWIFIFTKSTARLPDRQPVRPSYRGVAEQTGRPASPPLTCCGPFAIHWNQSEGRLQSLTLLLKLTISCSPCSWTWQFLGPTPGASAPPPAVSAARSAAARTAPPPPAVAGTPPPVPGSPPAHRQM